jgi:hypothetical protein
MNKIVKNLSILVFVFGAIALMMGVAFLYEGISKDMLLVNIMNQEDVKLSDLGVTGSMANDVIDSEQTAQVAGDTVRGHRHSIATTYKDLLAGGRYDPTNMKDLTYAQAMNLENYLYLGVLSFGVTQIAMATGGFMVLMALALGAIGFVLLMVARTLK